MKLNVVVAIVTLLSLLSSCSNGKQEFDHTRPIKIYKANTVESVQKSFSGIVMPDQYSVLAFKVSGPIITMNVDNGSFVKKGDIIAALDPADYKLTYEAKRASYNTAKSQLERAKKLLTKQAVSRQEYESTEASYENAKASFDNATSNLNQTVLRAPFGGFIYQKFAENYQKVQAGEKIVSIVNPKKLLIKFTLPESNLSSLLNNPRISVEFDNIPGRLFNAKIKEYVPASTDGSGLPVTLEIDDSNFNSQNHNIAIGFSCRVVMENILKSDNSGVRIPIAALNNSDDNDKISVFVLNRATSTVNIKAVVIGDIIEKEMVIIKSGIVPGDEVVIGGVTRLSDGKKVKVLNE